MPGRLFLTQSAAALAETFAGPVPEMRPRLNIAPGQQILTYCDEGWQEMRWGIIPVGRVNARGRPVMETLINARSETVFDKSAYDGVGRAVVPASGWYEWTGEKRRKQAWRIRPKDEGVLWFAGVTDVWQAPGGLQVPQVATVTCPPNGDVAEIHHRMGVLMRSSDVGRWLSDPADEVQDLMVPWPEGQLSIEKADDVDWTGD